MTDLPITYTRDRSRLRAAALMWGTLFGVEVFAFSVLAVVLLPAMWMKLATVFILIAGSGAVLARFVLAPLWTYHLLTPDMLIIRYGRDALTIPRSRISAVEPAHERLPNGYQASFSTSASQRRLIAALSTANQLLIRIDPPLDAGLGFPIEEVLINTDEPAMLLGLGSAAVDAEVPAADPVSLRPLLPPRIRVPSTPDPDSCAGIACIGVTKRYGDRLAVDDLTFQVAPGEIYGLLGPNGAGKSTTIAVLTGIALPDRGAVRLAGHDLRLHGLQARRALGYVPDRPILYDTLTGREFLSYVAQLHAIPRDTAAPTIANLIAALDFGPYADARCRTYSFGTRSKVALAAALLHDLPVLVLDEPFNGLDPLSAHDVRAMLVERANAGAAILLSTHDLAIAETLCDRIGILANGRLVAEGNLDTLTEGGTIPLDARFRTLTRAARAVPAGAR
ncbi:MAG: ABC transporter ATP-binding protein [Thermomicrobiales bacterium]